MRPGHAEHAAGAAVFAERLAADTHEARIRNFQQALDTARGHQQEEAARLQGMISTLRREIAGLKKELADQEATMAMQSNDLASRDGLLADKSREGRQLQEQIDIWKLDATKLQKQVQFAMEQARQSKSDAAAAIREKEVSLNPLKEKVEELQRSIAVQKRQVDLMQQDTEAANRRVSALQLELAAASERLEQERSARQDEARLGEQRQEDAQAEMQAQAARYERRERLLRARCRLLQTWCFHTWWALDSEADPLTVLEACGDDESLGPSMSTSRGSAATNVRPARVPRKRLPLPPDWRSVLRFQASLFHWLADETARGKVRAALPPPAPVAPVLDEPARAEIAQHTREELEAAVRRALGEATERERLRAQLSKAKVDVEQAAWQQERELLEAAATGVSTVTAGGHQVLPRARQQQLQAKLSALRTRTAGEAADLDEQMLHVQPLQPVQALLSRFGLGTEA